MKHIVTVTGAAMLAAAAVVFTTAHAPGVTGATGHVAHVSTHLAADASSGVVSYDSQGVTVSPPAAAGAVPAPAASTAQSVMQSFRAQQVPAGVIGDQMDSAPHTVAQQQVTESLPVSPEVVAGVPYAAWVVTYSGLPPVSYAPAPPPAGVSCTFVGVMNSATGDWTEFFSSCS
jgi:hypothetical protein